MKWLTAIFVSVLCFISNDTITAQNLVPNPSFEIFNSCPQTLAAIEFSPNYSSFSWVDKWVRPLINTTPDYYNSCAPAYPGSMVGVPKNWIGNRIANFGNAYTGIIAYSTPPFNNPSPLDYREYIECKLLAPLIKDHDYKVTFFVNYAYRTFYSYNYLAIDKIGAYFSDSIIVDNASYNLTYTPQVANLPNNYISDTSKWEKISGIYKAHGGEEWLTIGCFKDTNFVNSILISSSLDSNLYQYCYMYIDDVSVVDQTPCDSSYNSSDTIICDALPINVNITTEHNDGHYTWNTGDTTASINVNSFGTYWRRSVSNCSLIVDTFHIIAKPASYIEALHDTIICEGDEIVIGSPINTNRYIWNTNEIVRQKFVSKEGIYWVKAIDDCKVYIDTFKVKNIKALNSPSLGMDTTICDTSHLIIGSSVNGAHYTWNTGDSICCLNISNSGKYIRTLTNVCSTIADSIIVEVQNCNNCLFIPDIFSPNKDGKNDYFSIIPICSIKKYVLRVYDRWGELVFISDNLNKKWDGTFKGTNVEIGTYYYYIVYYLNDTGIPTQIKGDVIVIR